MLLEDAVLPVVIHVAFPHPHVLVVAASGDHALILRVGPGHLPDGSLVRLESLTGVLTAIGAHTADL